MVRGERGRKETGEGSDGRGYSVSTQKLLAMSILYKSEAGVMYVYTYTHTYIAVFTTMLDG